MEHDLTGVTFNRNQKQESAAREAALGVRWLIASFAFNLVAMAVAIAVAAMPETMGAASSVLGIVVLILAIAGFATGAYAIYSMMDALGWSGGVSLVIIAMMLVPYAKLLVPILAGAFALNLIGKAGFGFTLIGPLKRRIPPPLPSDK